ncbi:MAG: formimidoylglutamate deiminase [Betaproteobacteria bacterium]
MEAALTVPAGQHRVFAPLVFLPEGWARDVAMTIDDRGCFSAVEPNSNADGARRLDGVVLPGMVNAHSHAFQRAMVGLTQIAGPGTDNFWSWRTLMYALAGRLTPGQLEVIATWVYTEMLRGGYTHVCEFHYLHNDLDGRPYADPAALSRAVLRAAARVGIGMTLLPVLYMASGFGGAPPRDEQRRFVSTPEDLLEIVRTLAHEIGDDPMVAFGIAPHSLRAVPPSALTEAVAELHALRPNAPVHIHVAEQTGEVDACLAWSGRRPVDWLLENAAPDRRWNLVHATQMIPGETRAVAASGANVVLCPTTEADLGDGVFPYADYAAAQGAWAIGSDSQVCRDWQSELRMLEYSQRLQCRQRNVGAASGASTGESLFRAALAGGAQASGLPLGRIAAGSRADWVTVRADKVAFAGRPPEHYLDSLIFDHHAADFADIVIAGKSRRGSLESDSYRLARSAFMRTLDEVGTG